MRVAIVACLFMASCAPDYAPVADPPAVNAPSLSVPQWLHSVPQCGRPADPPVPVYRRYTDALCFHTRWLWCDGEIVLAKHVVYERRTAVSGERIWCEGDNKRIDTSEFARAPYSAEGWMPKQ